MMPLSDAWPGTVCTFPSVGTFSHFPEEFLPLPQPGRKTMPPCSWHPLQVSALLSPVIKPVLFTVCLPSKTSSRHLDWANLAKPFWGGHLQMGVWLCTIGSICIAATPTYLARHNAGGLDTWWQGNSGSEKSDDSSKVIKILKVS